MGRRPERNDTDPAFYEAFGRAVATLRTARRMSRADLAEAAGISYSYVASIEAGTKLPAPGIRSRIASALGLTDTELVRQATDLLGGDQGSAAGGSVAHAMMSDTLSAPMLPALGAITELETLVHDLPSEDRRLVVDLARRLAAAQGPPARALAAAPPAQAVDTRGALYHRFWSRYLARLHELGLDWAAGREPVLNSSLSLPSGIRGGTIVNRFARRRQLRHEIHIDLGSLEANRQVLAGLEASRPDIESAHGAALEIDPPGPERRSVRVAEYRPGHIDAVDEHDEYIEWFVEAGRRLRRTLETVRPLVTG